MNNNNTNNNADFPPRPVKEKEDLHDLFATIQKFISEQGGDAVQVPNTPLVDMATQHSFLDPAMAEYLLAGADSHPALGLVGELFMASSQARTATVSALQQNLWRQDQDDAKENMERLISQGEENYIRFVSGCMAISFCWFENSITREQLSLLSLANWKPQAASAAVQDPALNVLHPETGELYSQPRAHVSVYDSHGRKLRKKFHAMLEDVFEELNGDDPTFEEVEYIAKACGLSAHTVRDWCKCVLAVLRDGADVCSCS
jgi:hypothetical protein